MMPVNNDGPVLEIVGSTFEKIVRNIQKDVLVLFYAPWSKDCKKFKPMWEELAESFAPVNDLHITRMDATSNDADGIHIGGYPTFMFFPRD